MIERLLSPRLMDIVEAIEHIREAMEGVPLVDFEQSWQKRWLVEHEMKARQPGIPWSKVAGIGSVLRRDYDHIAPDVLWKVMQDDLPILYHVCQEELRIAVEREERS